MDSNPFPNPSILSALQATLKLRSNRVGTAIVLPEKFFQSLSASFGGPVRMESVHSGERCAGLN